MSRTQTVVRYYPNYIDSVGFIAAFRRLANDFYANRYLLWRYFKKDFKGSYQRSSLGVIWKLILPLIPLSVYIILQELGFLVGSTATPRALFVVIGMTLWQFFTSVLTTTVTRLDSQSSIVKRIRLPISVIYLSGLGPIVFDLCVRLGLMYAMLVYYQITPNIFWVLLPLLVIPFLFSALGMGILLSFLGVYSKDIKNVVSIFVAYGLFASEVIFPVPTGGRIDAILNVNVFRHLINGSRDLLVTGEVIRADYFFGSLVLCFLVFGFAIKKMYQLERAIVDGV